MSHCTSIKNLFTRSNFNCNLKINDEYSFLYKTLEYQPHNVLFLYKFDNNKKYVTVHNDEDFLIEPIEDDLALKLLENLYDVDRDNKEKKINSIADKIIELAKIHNINDVGVDKDKLIDFIRKIDNNPLKQKVLDIRDEYIEQLRQKEMNDKLQWKKNQKGGVLIWAMETYLFPKLPETVQTILWSILEIIDVALIIASSIPGLQFVAGLGIIIDIIAIIYAFLRFDVVGTIGALISFIPIVGDVAGGGIRIIAKIYKYYSKFKKVNQLTKYGINAHKKFRRGAQTIDAFGNVVGKKGEKISTIVSGAQTLSSIAPQQDQEQYDQQQYDQQQYDQEQYDQEQQNQQYDQQQYDQPLTSTLLQASPLALLSGLPLTQTQGQTIQPTQKTTKTTKQPLGAPKSPKPTGAPKSPKPTGAPKSPKPTGAPKSPKPTGAPKSPKPTGAPKPQKRFGSPSKRFGSPSKRFSFGKKRFW